MFANIVIDLCLVKLQERRNQYFVVAKKKMSLICIWNKMITYCPSEEPCPTVPS